MKKVPDQKKMWVPNVRIDKTLNKYDNIVLFPEKVEKAKEMLRTVGLPKIEKPENDSLLNGK